MSFSGSFQLTEQQTPPCTTKTDIEVKHHNIYLNTLIKLHFDIYYSSQGVTFGKNGKNQPATPLFKGLWFDLFANSYVETNQISKKQGKNDGHKNEDALSAELRGVNVPFYYKIHFIRFHRHFFQPEIMEHRQIWYGSN